MIPINYVLIRPLKTFIKYLVVLFGGREQNLFLANKNISYITYIRLLSEGNQIKKKKKTKYEFNIPIKQLEVK